MKKYGYYMLTLLLNSVLALLLPYLLLLFIIDAEYIMYAAGTLDSSAAAHMRGEGDLLPFFILFTLIFTAAFLFFLIVFNRIIYRKLHTTKLEFIAAIAAIFIFVLILDLVIDPFHFMWRYRDLLG